MARMADKSSGRQSRWMEMADPGPAFPGVASQSIMPRKFRPMATRIIHDNPTLVVAFSFVPVVFCPCGRERQKTPAKAAPRFAVRVEDSSRDTRSAAFVPKIAYIVNFRVGDEARLASRSF